MIRIGIAIACFITTSAMATDYKAGSLAIGGLWSRATPKGAESVESRLRYLFILSLFRRCTLTQYPRLSLVRYAAQVPSSAPRAT